MTIGTHRGRTESTTSPGRPRAPSHAGMNRHEVASIVWMTSFVVGLHIVGWSILLLTVSRTLELGTSGAFGIGLGITAYTLGMRHAFDADHIAAIDNTTRKLLTDRKEPGRPLSVGFFFSLGHSTVVFVLCALLAVGLRAIGGQAGSGSSPLQRSASTIGTTVSAVFLLTIGVLNALILVGILKVFRGMRSGDFNEQELEDQLNNRGLMNRLLRGVTKTVTRPWHMYLVGLLFGLGFDTATEVSLLVVAAGAATLTLPWYALLALPILFAAGMTLLDSIDGAFMGIAYDWAFLRPVRKVYYNLTVTGLSVLVALGVGSIEIIGLVSSKFGITYGPVAWIGRISLDHVGYAVASLFVVTWALSSAVWRFGHIEQRWSRSIDGP